MTVSTPGPGASWEVVEHTADVGLRAWGPDVESALSQLVVGFGRLLCPEGRIEARETRELEIDADVLEDAVVDLLDEANFLAQTEGFLPAACTVRLGRNAASLTAELGGEPYDRDRHGHLMEVKAVTYHGLVVERDPGRVEVIFDI